MSVLLCFCVRGVGQKRGAQELKICFYIWDCFLHSHSLLTDDSKGTTFFIAASIYNDIKFRSQLLASIGRICPWKMGDDFIFSLTLQGVTSPLFRCSWISVWFTIEDCQGQCQGPTLVANPDVVGNASDLTPYFRYCSKFLAAATTPPVDGPIRNRKERLQGGRTDDRVCRVFVCSDVRFPGFSSSAWRWADALIFQNVGVFLRKSSKFNDAVDIKKSQETTSSLRPISP